MSFSRVWVVLILFWGGGAWGGQVVGHLTRIEGEVRIGSKEVTRNTLVELGQTITTGDGRATLLLGKDTVIHLAPQSRLEVTKFLLNDEKGEDVLVQLPYGTTRALIRNKGVKKDFKLRSRGATMGVRGTHIYVDTPADANAPQSFATFEGLAEVRVGAETTAPAVPLAANQSVQVSVDDSRRVAPSEVRAISPAEALQLATQVAPPPVVATHSAEVRSDGSGERGERGRRDREVRDLESMLARRHFLERNIDLDPLREGGNVPIGIRILGRKVQ